MVSLPQVSRGIITFIEKELIFKADSKKQFVMWFIIPQIPKKTEQLFNSYKNNIVIKDFITSEGIDIENLYKYSKEAIKKVGNMELFGVVLNEQDIDKIYEYITKAIV